MGIPLEKNFFKIRMAINSEWKGKSAGARIIYTSVFLGGFEY